MINKTLEVKLPDVSSRSGQIVVEVHYSDRLISGSIRLVAGGADFVRGSVVSPWC